MNPIYNPPVPMNSHVSMQPGFMIYVTGIPTGNRFSINLKCGPGPQANNAFHFNPRFDDGFTVVRNTMRNNRWEAEERQANGFPFQMGQKFEIIVLCQQNQYKVAVNGRHFIEYKHRIPFQHVQYLTIQGGVSLQMVKFDQEAPSFPHVAHNPYSSGFGAQHSSQPKVTYNPVVPYKMAVPFNNIKNKSVTIKGLPENRNPHRMMLDFETDNVPPDILFHFNPRFNDRVIVRNTRMSNSWGKEERALSVPFPFQYGVPFQLVISVEQGMFRVSLNGMVICTYNHRQRPLTRIRHINVGGSVRINEICFN